MKTNKMVMALGAIGMLLLVGYSCGGSSGGSSGTTAKHIAVDPYIVGAQFFEDLDGNGIQDEAEQLSTLTDANGLFTFSSPLSTGAIVVLSDTGTAPLHNGVDFTGKIKRLVDASGSLVCSPLTTLLANGWEEVDIIDALSDAGLASLAVADLRADPMAGINNLTTITEGGLSKIRASIAVYSFMAIMDELIAGQGFDIDFDTFDADADAKAALAAMVDSINYCLSPTLLVTIQDMMDDAEESLQLIVPIATLPAVTVGDVIKSAVAMANWIIPQVAALEDPATFSLDTEAYADMAFQLGLNFYLIRNKANMYIIGGIDSIPGALDGILEMDTLTVADLPVPE